MINVAVLGGRGFVGQFVVKALGRSSGYKVKVLSSAHCDLLDKNAVKKELETIEYDAHYIFLSSILILPEEPREIYAKNVEMAQNFVEAVATRRPAGVIYASSAEVYGRPPLETPITESTPARPTGYYGLSKLVSEGMFRFQLKCPASILRLPGIYGINETQQSVVGGIIEKLRNGQTIELVGGGSQLRDYVYVEDVAKVILALIERPWDGLINLASEKSYSIKEIVQMAEDALKMRANVKEVKSSSLVYDLTFRTTTLKNAVSNLKMTELPEGILKLVAARSS